MENTGRDYVELLFENGDVYKGEIEDYKFSGYGIFKKNDKFIYAGEFKQGLFNGYGRYWEPSQLMIYQGEFKNGQKTGAGRLETYMNNISYGSLVPQQSEVNDKEFKNYIKNFIVNEVKKDIESVINKIISEWKEKFSLLCAEKDASLTNSYAVEQIKEYKISEETIDDLKTERTKSTYERRYVGEFKCDFKSGYGVMNYANHDIYKGQFENDKRHGIGEYIYLSINQPWSAYLGYFSEDAMSGFGKMIFKNGDKYVGEFKNNKMHDEQGLFEYSNFDKYKGGVAQNMKHSRHAEYLYSNGDKYVGGFRDDKKEGKGTITLYNDDITYEGEFKNDNKTGFGEIEIKSSNVHISSEFDENELINTDSAKIEFRDEQMTYTGSLRNSKIHGFGVISHLDTGNEYKGQFKNNHKHGPWEFILKNGGKKWIFSGEFSHGVEQSLKSKYGKET